MKENQVKNGMNKKYDFVLVGSGLFNATFARLATDKGYKCLVVEKRDHIGGNIYDKKLYGINVHAYGAHIFHTSDEEVWDFVNKYTKFNNYINSPIANYHDELYNLPFNMNTFHQIWPDIIHPNDAKLKIESQKNEYKGEPTNLEEQAISLVGKDIYEKLIKGYTEKQWGSECTTLPSDIIKRLPVRFTYNNNYFNDTYQGIPINGYTDLINTLFEGCDIIYNEDYLDKKDYYNSIGNTIVYTGEIDRFFDYLHGKLKYRSLIFEQVYIDECQNYQGNAVVNYTDSETPYTRIIEHKHFDVWNKEVQEYNYTWITKEYPFNYSEGCEPYYPINDGENMSKVKLYNELKSSVPHVIFGGRLAEYKYYDMDKTIRSAIDKFNEYIKKVEN